MTMMSFVVPEAPKVRGNEKWCEPDVAGEILQKLAFNNATMKNFVGKKNRSTCKTDSPRDPKSIKYQGWET